MSPYIEMPETCTAPDVELLTTIRQFGGCQGETYNNMNNKNKITYLSPHHGSALTTLLAIRYSSILTTCLSQLNTHCSTLLESFLSTSALSCTSSYITLSICVTFTKLLKHLILRTILWALFIPPTTTKDKYSFV